VLQLFRRPFLSEEAAATLTRKTNAAIGGGVTSIATEQCFNIEVTAPLTAEEMGTLQWLLRETFEPELFTEARPVTAHIERDASVCIRRHRAFALAPVRERRFRVYK